MKITKRQLRGLIKEACGDVSLEKPEIYGHGGKARMAKQQLFNIANDAAELHHILNDDDELPEWVQSKIAVVQSSMDAVFDHLEYKYRDHLGGDEVIAVDELDGELDFTGDVADLGGDEAFGVGYAAGKRGL